MIKLNIGGGKGHPKMQCWKVIDIRQSSDIILDITKEKLPFDDDTVDVIFCSHTLEHIYRKDLKFVLDEFYRVIKTKTGVVRISVPDIRKACLNYLLNNKKFFFKSSVSNYDKNSTIGGLLADWFYSFRDDNLGNGHVHCFDYEYLKYWLKNSGFTRIKRMKFRKSSLKELEIDGLDLRKNDSIFLEATKNGK